MSRNSVSFLDWPVIALKWVWKQVLKLFGQTNGSSSPTKDVSINLDTNFVGESSVEVTWLRYANDGQTMDLMKKFFRNNFYFEPFGVYFYDVSIFADDSKSEGFAGDPEVELITVAFTFFVEKRTDSVPSLVKTRKEWAALMIQRIHDQLFAETPWEDEGRVRYLLTVDNNFVEAIPQAYFDFPELARIPLTENHWCPEFQS